MTATNMTTLTQLINVASIEQASELDPNNDLGLTDAEHEALNARATAAFEEAADKILAPYGCYMLGNGEIILRDIDDDTVAAWDEEAVREAIANIDLGYLLD